MCCKSCNHFFGIGVGQVPCVSFCNCNTRYGCCGGNNNRN